MNENDRATLFASERHDWQTPDDIFAPLHHEFAFTVDVAATADNAMIPRFWTESDDGLAQPWDGERVWCNPPYGNEQKGFVKKAAERRAEVSVLLIPARTDTAIWHDYIFPLAEVRFLRGRVRFVGSKSSAPFPSAVVVFRREA